MKNKPEDIFSHAELDDWAWRNGYKKEGMPTCWECRYHDIYSIVIGTTKTIRSGCKSEEAIPGEGLLFTPERFWCEDYVPISEIFESNMKYERRNHERQMVKTDERPS